MLKGILLILIIILSVQSFGQLRNFESVGLNVSEDINLPSLESYKVKQDRSGNIWICTDGGVVKYDGNESYTFTVEDGLLNNVVFDIYEDYKGRIWFLGMKNELCYYFENKIHPYPYNNQLKELFKNGNFVWKSIYVDEEDNLYYSLFSKGIKKIDNKGKISTFHQKKGITINKFKRNDLISILTSNSYTDDSLNYLFDYELYYNDNREVVHFDKINNSLHPPLALEGTNYYLLFGSLFAEGNKEPIFNELNYFQKFHDKLIISTRKGFFLVQPNNKNFSKVSKTYLPGKFITSTCLDSEGGLWISTLEDGVYYFSTMHLESLEFFSKTENDNILQISSFNNSVLALTYDKIYTISKDTVNRYSYENNFNRMVPFDNEIHLFCTSQLKLESIDHFTHHTYARDAKVFGNKIYYSNPDKLMSFNTRNNSVEIIMSKTIDERFTYAGYLEIIDTSEFLVSDINNLYLIENKTITKVFRDSLDIKAIQKVNSDSIYVLDRTAGIYIYSIKNKTLTPHLVLNKLLPKADYNNFTIHDSTFL